MQDHTSFCMNLSPSHQQFSGRLLAPAVFEESLQFFVPFTSCSLQSFFSLLYCIFIFYFPKFISLSVFYSLTGLQILKECHFLLRTFFPYSAVQSCQLPFSQDCISWYILTSWFQHDILNCDVIPCKDLVLSAAFFSLFLTSFLIFTSITFLLLSTSSLHFLAFWNL